jgi:hypothetical protein
MDLDEHLAAFEIGDGDVVQYERGAGFVEDCGFSFHDEVLSSPGGAIDPSPRRKPWEQGAAGTAPEGAEERHLFRP